MFFDSIEESEEGQEGLSGTLLLIDAIPQLSSGKSEVSS